MSQNRRIRSRHSLSKKPAFEMTTPSVIEIQTPGQRDFWTKEKERQLRLCNDKWRFVKELHQKYRFNISKFSDFCFAQERNRFVTRVLFIDALNKQHVPRYLIKCICNCFDASGKGEIDWRYVIFMVHTITHPNLLPGDDLENVFKFYTGRVPLLLLGIFS